jgi:4-hydroxy-tetrahydrodipicolinate reductase
MKLAIMGAAGRMGRALIAAAHATPGCELIGGSERPGSPAIGADLGELAGLGRIGAFVTDKPVELFVAAQAVLDFTRPEASLDHAELAAQARIVHVIGTTGFTPEEEARIEAAAAHAVIVKSGNMSLGVNVLAALTRRLAQALDEDFDIEIVEMHHRHKVDAPSGTALMLGRAAADGRGVPLDERMVPARHGHTGERRRGDIGFAVLRGGDVIGDHTVVFAGPMERIELTHRAASRDIFARGAIKAALWGVGKPPGLYSMQDVLGI